MKEQTLNALKESIEHWRRLATGKILPGEYLGSENCSLCGLFIIIGCNGCPVSNFTHVNLCRQTPYGTASRIASDFGLDSPLFHQAAQKELDFLISLLPEN